MVKDDKLPLGERVLAMIGYLIVQLCDGWRR